MEGIVISICIPFARHSCYNLVLPHSYQSGSQDDDLQRLINPEPEDRVSLCW